MRKRTFLACCAALLCTGWAQAQITGRTLKTAIVDQVGQPIPGVTLVAKKANGEHLRTEPAGDAFLISDVGDKVTLFLKDAERGTTSTEVTLPQDPNIMRAIIDVYWTEKGAVPKAVAFLPADTPDALSAVPTTAPGPRYSTMAMTCDPGSLFAQNVHDPNAAWSAATSEVDPGYLVYENFFGVGGDIETMRFWGLRLWHDGFGWNPCTEDPVPFNITFYDDAGGTPGTAQCSYNISVAGVFTGNTYAGFADLFEYNVNLPTPCSLSDGWVSIEGDGLTTCWFMWMSGDGGDSNSLQWDGTALTDTGYDRGLCLGGQYVPVYGACCDDSTGTCTDNVEQLDCDASFRFEANTLCADLDPACGSITGCDHSVELWDDYGDGWNGGTLDVLVNGVVVLDDITLAGGYGPVTYTFTADTGDAITTVYTAGGWSYENYYYVYDGLGAECCSDGLGGATPVGCSCTGNCGGSAGCDHSVVLTDDYGDGWNGGYLDIYVNGTLAAGGVTLAYGYGPETFYFTADNGDDIDVVYTAGSWSYENEYYVYDGVGIELCSDGLNGTTPVGCMDLVGSCGGGAPCDHTIVLTDDYGDGWNGGTVDVLVNGTLVLDDLTILYGSGPETHTFQAATGDTITTVYVAGSWSYENEYHIYDVNGTEICADGTGGTTPTGCTATGWCEIDPCIGNEPPNDLCTDATLITTPYPQAVCGTNECATTDCPGVLDWDSTWWEITLPYALNDLTIDFCGNGFEINNIGIVIYEDCTDCNAYILRDTLDWYSCPDGIVSPIIGWDRLPGPTTVLFPVYFNDNTKDAYCFTANVDEVIPPPNELCENAIPVGVPSVTQGTTNSALVPVAPTCNGVSPTSPGVWYTVVGNGNTFTASLCDSWSEYDSKLSVYCGDCDDLICIDGNDDFCNVLSEVTWCSQFGATYYILVHGYGGASGDFTLTLTDHYEVCTYDVGCMPEGACCLPDASCVIIPQYDCQNLGGWYQGDDTDCGAEAVEEFLQVCNDHATGTLDSSSPVWDRVFGSDVDPNCAASLFDSSSNGQYYAAIPIQSSVTENLVCEVLTSVRR
jgi:hypothetical protein